MKLFDYECVTTFWEDFTIAEHFGSRAIRDTYRRAFDEWKENTVYLTELVMVLNHKLWAWYESGKSIGKVYSRLYNDLWEEASTYAETHLTGEDMDYYFRVTD